MLLLIFVCCLECFVIRNYVLFAVLVVFIFILICLIDLFGLCLLSSHLPVSFCLILISPNFIFGTIVQSLFLLLSLLILVSSTILLIFISSVSPSLYILSPSLFGYCVLPFVSIVHYDNLFSLISISHSYSCSNLHC